MNKLNPKQIEFLRPLDELMKAFVQQDKQYFCQLFERKKQLIQTLMSIGVDPEKYFAFVTKVYKSEGPQKEFAKMDLILLRDTHKMDKQAWFEQLVTDTQMALTQQEAKYNQYMTQQHQHQQQHQKSPVQQPTAQQNSTQPPSNTSNPLQINIVQFTNLKLLDEYMSKYYQTQYKETFLQLFQKKQRIMQALQASKLTPSQYHMIAQKIFNEAKNDQVKKIVKNDLEMLTDLHDGNVNEWVKETLKESKDEVKGQKEVYDLHKRGVQVDKRQLKAEIDLDAYMQIPIPPNTDPAHCISFSLLDRYMKHAKSNPSLYVALYQKKQKLLSQLQSGKLTEKIYQQMITRMMKTVEKEDLKQIYQTQLNDIEDVHEGKVKQWFDNLVDDTKLLLMIQEDMYREMKQKCKSEGQQKKMEVEIDEKINSRPEPKKQQPKITQKQTTKPAQSNANIDPTLGYNLSQMFSLKVLENALITHQKNPSMFMKLFGQKKKIIDMMSNGELDAEKYKKLQQKLMVELESLKSSEQVRDEIQFDLQGIEDGDADEWFKEVVENAGMSYDGQMKRYQELLKTEPKAEYPSNQPVKKSKQSPSQPQKAQQTKAQKAHKLLQQTPSPFNIASMYSLKVIDNSLTQHQSNQPLYIRLFQQKQKIIKKMQDGEINAEKYKNIQSKMLEIFKDNEDVMNMIEIDLEEIQDQYDGDVGKWFEETVNSAGVGYQNQLDKYLQLQEKYGLKEQTGKVHDSTAHTSHTSTASIHSNQHYESPQKEFQSKLSEASNQINQSTPKSKIRFYLHEMAQWQSLARYFEKNNLDPNKNQLLKIYFNVPRHQVQEIIEKIKTEAGYDIVSYCKKFFPPITEAVFYKGAQNFGDKIEQGVIACNKEINQLKEYVKNLRKGLNTKNFEKVKNTIAECQENIKYLTNLPALIKKTSKLIPLPLIEEIPINWPNMDQYSHLEANQVELKITKIQGLKDQHNIKIHVDGTCRHESKVSDGDQNIVIKGQQNPQNFAKVLRGDHRCFSVSFYELGWFSKSKIGLESLEMLFIRSNIHEGKVKIGKATLYYEGKVRMAKSPTMTEIKEVKITKYPAYEYSKQVEEDFIAKYTTSSKV